MKFEFNLCNKKIPSKQALAQSSLLYQWKVVGHHKEAAVNEDENLPMSNMLIGKLILGEMDE